MANIDPLLTSEYRQFVADLDPQASFNFYKQKEDEHLTKVTPWLAALEHTLAAKSTETQIDEAKAQRKKAKYVAITVFQHAALRDEGKTNKIEQAEPTKESKEPEENNPTPDFLRIIDITTLIPKSEAALITSPKGYKKLQHLGLTINNDPAFTAQIIGAIGTYRFRVLKDQVQYGMRTDKFHQKEAICQQAFQRLEALQIVERSFGKSWSAVKIALNVYLQQIEQYKPNSNSYLAGSAYQEDYNAAIDMLREIEPSVIAEQSNLIVPCYGFDPTKNKVERFVRRRANRIVDRAKTKNEKKTIANGNSFFRGELQKSLAEAEKICTKKIFNQNEFILPEHQGDYNDVNNPNKKITILSSTTIGESKAEIRKFLLGASYVLHGEEDDIFEQADENFSTGFTRGWRRLFKREIDVNKENPTIGSRQKNKNLRILKDYYKFREAAAISSVSWLKSLLKEIGDVVNSIVDRISQALRGVIGTIGKVAYKLFYSDYVLPRTKQLDPVRKQLTPTENQWVNDENWARKSNWDRIKHYCSLNLQNIDPAEIKLTEAQEKEFLVILQQRYKTVAAQFANKPAAILASPPSQLEGFYPDDFLSSIVGGVESFYDYFDQLHEASPCTAFYCLILYTLAGLSAVKPDLITALFERLKLGAISPAFITWHRETARAFTNGTVSNFISAGFTAWKELLVVSETLSGAGDSILGEAVKYFGDNAPKVIVGFVFAFGLGALLVNAGIPVISKALREDAGTVPNIESTIAGLKLSVVGYNSFYSKPETLGAFANFFSFAFNTLFLPIRLIFSPIINFFIGLHPDVSWKETGTKIANTYKEAVGAVASAALRLIDATLRVLDLVGRFIKMLVKTTMEWFINTLTVLTKFLGCIFVNPKHNQFSKLLVVGKEKLFNLCDQCISRPLKNGYRICRNAIARFFIRRHFNEESMKVLAHMAESTTAILAKRLNKAGKAEKDITKEDLVIIDSGSTVELATESLAPRPLGSIAEHAIILPNSSALR